jgi:hypothetical protein
MCECVGKHHFASRLPQGLFSRESARDDEARSSAALRTTPNGRLLSHSTPMLARYKS